MSEPKSFGRADRLYQCRPRMRSVGVDQHPRTGPHSPEHHLLRQVQLAVDQYVAHTWTGQPDGDGVALASEPTSCPQPATGRCRRSRWAGSVASRGVRRSRSGDETGNERRERRGAGLHRDQARVPQTSGRHRTGGGPERGTDEYESLSAAGTQAHRDGRPDAGVRPHRGEQFAAEMPGFDRVAGVAQAWSGTWDHCWSIASGWTPRQMSAAADSTSVAGRMPRRSRRRRAPGRRVVRRRRRCVRHPPHRRRGARPMRRRRRRRTGAPPTRCGGRRPEADRPGCRTPRRPECR